MKNLTCSIVAALALSSFAVAGGNIEPVAAPMEEMAPAPDDSGFYIGGAVSLVNVETDAYGEYGNYASPPHWWDESVDSDEIGYMLQAGYQFNQYIAVEGRYWNAGTSVDGSRSEGYIGGPQEFTDSWSDECGDMTAWGIYVKPMYPVTEAINIYALLGYGNTSIDDERYADGVELIDKSGFQWGIGASYEYDEHISFFIDYVQLASDAEESYDWVDEGNSYYVDWETSVYTINVGVSYKF